MNLPKHAAEKALHFITPAFALALAGTIISSRSNCSADSISKFLNCANITLPTSSFITPSSKEYTEAATGQRARILRFPAAVYYPRNEAEIITAVFCALQADIRVVPRGGGHSYESFSSQNHSLVIDLCEFNNVQVLDTISSSSIDHTDIAMATVEAGARLGNVYIALAEKGFNFPGGTCPSVGIGGLIGGGGYGLTARQYGLASDSVLAMRVVLYNGSLIAASPTQHSDLFWALRGGNAGSFGIVTQYTIQTYKNSLNTMFYITYNTSIFPQLIDTFMKHFPTIDRRLTTQLQMNKEEIKFWGQFLGSKEELYQILGSTGVLSLPVQRQAFRDDCSLVGVKAFPLILDCSNVTDYQTIRVPFHLGSSLKELGKYKADYSSVPLNSTGAQIILEAILNSPSPGAWIQFETILGSRISDFQVQDSPYVNRKSLYSMQYTVPLERDDTIPSTSSPSWLWIRKLEADLKPFVNGLHYQNYPDLDLGADYGNKYYGAENFARLQQIKARYDPFNIFRNEQSIPLPSIALQ